MYVFYIYMCLSYVYVFLWESCISMEVIYFYGSHVFLLETCISMSNMYFSNFQRNVATMSKKIYIYVSLFYIYVCLLYIYVSLLCLCISMGVMYFYASHVFLLETCISIRDMYFSTFQRNLAKNA